MEIDKRVFGLDLLRAAAVIGVVVSHGFNLVPPAARTLIERMLFLPAYFGVELFFVLSGFLIGSILLREKHTESFERLREFWFRRWFRTLPNYYLYMLLTLLSVIILGQGSELHWRDLLDLLFLQNFAWAHSHFYSVAWSLAVEEWFYLLFPLAVLLARHRHVPFRGAFVGVACLFILGPTLLKYIASMVRPDLFWAAHYWKIVIFRLDAVMFGVIAAYCKSVSPNGWTANRFRLMVPTMVLLVTVVACFNSWIIVSARIFDIFICPLTSLGFALSLPYFYCLDRRRFGPFAVLFGRVALYSYSIYLLHPIILETLEHFATCLSLGYVARYGLIAVLVVVSYLLSKLNYHLYEKPMMDLREAYSTR